ncbi:hypothetical protein CKQ79_30090, partial [Klebsiella pneumoniae]
ASRCCRGAAADGRLTGDLKALVDEKSAIGLRLDSASRCCRGAAADGRLTGDLKALVDEKSAIGLRLD